MKPTWLISSKNKGCWLLFILSNNVFWCLTAASVFPQEAAAVSLIPCGRCLWGRIGTAAGTCCCLIWVVSSWREPRISWVSGNSQHAVSLVSRTRWDLGLYDPLRVCTWCNDHISITILISQWFSTILYLVLVIIKSYAGQNIINKCHLNICEHCESDFDCLNHN